MSDSVFLLGLGAQKAGTSWLHQMLSTSPETDMGFLKEYHVFDGLTVPGSGRVRPTLVNAIRRLRLSGRHNRYVLGTYLRSGPVRAFYRDPCAYFDYFAERLAQPGIRLTGDLTPDYSALSLDTMRDIREGFEARGVPVRAVLLMRDPVARCWSHIRMEERNRGYGDRALRDFRQAYASDRLKMRTRYDLTLERAFEAFGRDAVHVALFEELFEEGVLGEICAFLGIRPISGDKSRVVNASPKKSSLPYDLRRTAAEHYGAVYRYAADLMGEDRIRARWSNASLVL